MFVKSDIMCASEHSREHAFRQFQYFAAFNLCLARRVIYIETGGAFSSLKEASRMKHVDWSSLAKVCLGKRHTAGGYHWRYSEEAENKKSAG